MTPFMFLGRDLVQCLPDSTFNIVSLTGLSSEFNCLVHALVPASEEMIQKAKVATCKK